MTDRQPVLSIKNLQVKFNTYAGVAQVLNGINLDIYEQEVVGLVGETGCGKSVTALSILRLIDYPGEIVGGEINFEGRDLVRLSEKEIRKIRGNRISMIFQDPSTYLNPVLPIGDQIAEAIRLHQKSDLERTLRKPFPLSKWEFNRAVQARVIRALQLVRMPDPEKVMKQYPHELSGGMNQRCMIAIALACQPALLIADEATTNLDVTIQARVLQLMMDLRRETGASMLIITHDLGIVAETCDRVAVMYAGDIVEEADVCSLFDAPHHPYTIGLLGAVPTLARDTQVLKTIPGVVPSLIGIGPGCRFNPRCQFATDLCRRDKPARVPVAARHFVACHHTDAVLAGRLERSANV